MIAIERAPGKSSSLTEIEATRMVRFSRRPCASSVVAYGSDQFSSGVSSIMAFRKFRWLSLTVRT
jgi:hypothetical protein